MRITQRLELIKLTVLLGLFVSILLSYNLWAGQRWFPKVPVFEGYRGLIPPYDYINIIVIITLLFFSFTSQRKMPLILLVLFSLYLCFDDQNRLQPWFYNYVLIIIVLLFYKHRVDESNNYTTVFISLQILVALIYMFSGIQKLNSSFVDSTFKWMLSSLDSVLNQRQINLCLKLGFLIPYIEFFIGLFLLFKPMRFIALPLVIVMHLFILLLLGPFGKAYNFVIWPWNIIMIVLNLLLFANVPKERFFDISILFKGVSFYLVVTLMFIFPIFSFNNKYDSYLSSSLYSGNTHDCKLILSDKDYHKLPYYLRSFITTNSDYNILNIKLWAYTELKVPCVPEYRVFEKVHSYINSITQSNDVKMEFTEREKIINF